MKRKGKRLVGGLILAGISSWSHAGTANIVLGHRVFVDEDWEAVEVDKQPAVGLLFFLGGDPLREVVGVLFSQDEETVFVPSLGSDVRVELTAVEFDFGITRFWEGSGRSRPFLGGGFAFLRAELELALPLGGFNLSPAGSDTTGGLYVNGGILWRITKKSFLGIDGRIVRVADVDIEDEEFGLDEEFDMDYEQFGMVFGWNW